MDTRQTRNRIKASPIAYETARGRMLLTTAERALLEQPLRDLRGKVHLIFTSPPFPLTRKKRYGNRVGEEYLDWLGSLAPQLTELLAPDGSLVIEIGNAWEPGKPVMSTLPLEALLRIRESAELQICQQFICHNPARLPGPAQWVNIERIRVKDSYTHVWWMAKTDRPHADNKKVLSPYGKRMRQLLNSKTYNPGTRPSGHVIGEETFLRDNGGAIPASVLEFSNTSWSPEYLKHCKALGIKPHPARMAPGLAEFFIRFLTKPRDLVLDPFAGSNTTGAAAERLKRRWLSIEPTFEYVLGSKGQFEDLAITS